MKKKRLVLVLVLAVAIVTALIVAIIFTNHNSVQTGNPSRRDESGQNLSDDDLSAVDGSDAFADPSNSPIYSSEGKSSPLLEGSLIGEANNPISENVETVRRIVIPEAVTILDGDNVGFYANEDFKDVIPSDVSSFSDTDLPAQYDSRNYEGKCYVTEVEDQGYTYLCWSYAAIGAIESDILKHYSDISYKDLDLSEKHLAYYNVHKAEDTVNNGIKDDYRELVNADNVEGAWIFDYDTNYVAVGGVNNFCISLLTAWKGPVSEADNDAFQAIYGSEYLFKNNTSHPSNAYNSEYHIQNVIEVCASEENISLVKQMVMEHGAASIGVNADSKFWSQNKGSLYSYFNGEIPPTANHEVLIVGWDDDYSVSNFSHRPKADGAWICKNSWGEVSGKDGYFYLSYYDETAAISNAAAYSAVRPGAKGWYDNNYQVAGFITNVTSTLDDAENYVVTYSSSKNPYGVIYEAKGNENLEAFGLMAIDSYQQYQVEIYLNPVMDDDKLSFEDLGEPFVSQKFSAIGGGYHTFELMRSISLEAGDKFFILIKPETSGRLVMEAAGDMVSQPNYDEWNNLTGNFHNYYTASGQSYYISDDGNAMEAQSDKDFFIKAYTTNG